MGLRARGYEDYIEDVKSGKVPTCTLIKQAVARFEDFRARDDIYFDEQGYNDCVEFFATIKHFLGKSAGKPFILEPFQEFIIANLFLKYKSTGYRVCNELYIQVARKALALNTPILTTSGWSTMEKIEVGDYVFGLDGHPVKVNYTTPVFNGDCYKVSFEDGEEIIADADHEWFVKGHNWRKGGIKNTKELLHYSHKRADGKGTEYLWRVPMPNYIDNFSNTTLAIDPYILGLWLGDGSKKKPAFTCSEDDLEMYDYVSSIYGQPKTRKCSRHENTYEISYWGSPMQNDLRKVGVLDDKHIPEEYLKGNVSQRLALLQGLMDTDGYVSDRGECEFVQTSHTITSGVCELLSSLGIKYSLKEKIPTLNGKECNKAYRIHFYTDKTLPCFKLPRKVDRLKDHLNKRMDWKSIVKVEKVDNCKVKCIGVDTEDNIFLAGKKLTPTHNCGKDAMVAGLVLYLLVAEGEASPEIVCAANSTDQARILFNYITQFAKSIDPKGNVIKKYRNYVETEFNNGVAKVISSDSSRADGMNLSCYVLDEFHEAKDRLMYDVLKSSQGMREQPLAIIITTAGFNLDGPCHDMYNLAVEVLNGVKTMDNFFPFIWQLDPDDDWTDPKNFIKCQPNLGVTVTEEFMIGEVNKALVDSTAEVGVKTKTFNMWCQSEVTWIPREIIAKQMSEVNLEDYQGQFCVVGVDLSTVNDFSSICVFLPPVGDGPYVFKPYTFLPEETIKEHPNRELYKKFIQEGSMIITPGNCIDFDFIAGKIWEISQICPVSCIYYDRYQATQWAIQMTEMGFNLEPFGQGLLNYSAPTKEFERLAREGKLLIDKSANTLWQFGNVVLKVDAQNNVKPNKTSNKNKIDSVISTCTALGGWLKAGGTNDVVIKVY